MRPKPPHDENLLGQRIRNRREARGLAAYALAHQVRISPSYLSLIENGTKIPSDDIATRLARALDDDPELYRAWVQASRHPDLRQHLDRLMQVQSFRSSPELRGRLRRGEHVQLAGNQPPARHASAIRSALERLKLLQLRPVERDLSAMDELTVPFEPGFPETAALEIPLLSDGADPGEDPWIADGVAETIWLDRALLPPDPELPFAYRPGPAMVERVRRSIEPGDLVVLAAFDGSIDPSRIYAVRQDQRIVLSRVVPHGSILLLLPADESGRPASIECRDEAELAERLAGVVVATLRTFGGPGWKRAPGERPSGRSVRVEGDFLVRDTEWREPYGWRPVQRPEDVAWLEQHPGTKMRYRLIRDGRVRFLLELSPNEWREALGRYGRSPSWERNGYVVAITQRRGGDYTEEFQERWSRYVRRPEPEEEKV